MRITRRCTVVLFLVATYPLSQSVQSPPDAAQNRAVRAKVNLESWDVFELV